MARDRTPEGAESGADERIEHELGLERGETMAELEDETEQLELTQGPVLPPDADTAVEGYEEVNPQLGWSEPPAGHREADPATDDDVRRKG